MRLAFHEIGEARVPQLLQIEQMARLFLDSPFFASARSEQIARLATQHFFHASRRAAQPYAKIGKQIRGKGKFKFAFEPQAGVWHTGIVNVDRDAGESGKEHTKRCDGQIGCAAWPLAFAAFVAGFDPAGVPFLVFGMSGAEPALTPITENGGNFVAGLIQGRNSFARGLDFLAARFFSSRLRFHAAPA